MSQSPPSSRTSFGDIAMTYSDMIPPVGFQVSLPFSPSTLPVNGAALTSTPAWGFMPSALQDDRDPLSYFNPPSSIDLSPAGVTVTDHSEYASSVALSPALTALPLSPSSPLAPALPVSSGLLMTSPFAQPQTVLASSQAMDVGGHRQARHVGDWPDAEMIILDDLVKQPFHHQSSLLHTSQLYHSHHNTQWHPYSRQQSIPNHHNHPRSNSLTSEMEYDFARHFSAPSSPIITTSAAFVGNNLTLAPLPHQHHHRRTQSASDDSCGDLIGTIRRPSSGDLVARLVPGMSSVDISTGLSPESGFQVAISGDVSPGYHQQTLSESPPAPTPGIYKCEYEGCTKTFSRPYNLTSHTRTHTNQRPFQCDSCDRQFARLHDKNRHERLHRGVRPFACERCHHPFARMDALNRHLKVEGGRNLCNQYLIQIKSPAAMPIVELAPKKINPLIIAHFPNFGKTLEQEESKENQ
ncbi:hypothetical protein MVEG_05995 [Podila verticillata NRRL 6337]|nr:hypothetical protein MVEG_05995 [Podila verticillata NRRL 6337]